MHAKVPEVTAVFWVVKILTTGMGEAASDFLGTVNLVLAGVVGVGGFAAALYWQLHTDRYRPVAYWSAVAMVAVFGTMVADGVHVALGVPYAVSTAGALVLLCAVLVRWYRREGTVSIHSITTRSRETSYWLTVLITFALGTAAGDWTASSLHLGFLLSGVLFAAAIVVPWLAWRRGRLGEVAAFWTAYVITRPLGASFADWFGKPHSISGLGFGDGTVTGIALLAIVCLVTWIARTGYGVQRA